jgi:hypothetical protein
MSDETARLPSRQLTELLCKALLDSDVRERLFAEPEALAVALALSPAETEAIKRLDRGKFEQRVARLRST